MAMIIPVRHANILKINSYTSFGIMATIRFRDEPAPEIGELVQREGHLYKITGVVKEEEKQEGDIWNCKLEKI
ncbi:hypothetical protein [Chitinophaga nivalis]|uniref:DUF3127 domain-containing protein n=1 Tax=Chitinophaga nivalis TaxID=2991709 RepID=A0ABT3IIG7_9BACT|nr:hypothetical protein [Chitinophaga nivalis]MCW3466583.1 hypothetical protein [Chitinophaga nivalis]MCW3483726.1 hypothetical protein [Chitinophaga nivalis]